MSITLFLYPCQVAYITIKQFPHCLSVTPSSSSSSPAIALSLKPLITPKCVSSNATSSIPTSSFLHNSPTTIPTANNESEGSDIDEPAIPEPSELNGSGKIKMPTAPWMSSSLLLQPDEVLDFSKRRNRKKRTKDNPEKLDRSLTEKISGGRGRKAMKKLMEGIDKLRETNNSDIDQQSWDNFGNRFHIHDDGRSKKKMPWMKEERMVLQRTRKEKVLTAAEMSLGKELLERLRNEGAKMKKWVKVKKAGVTRAVVDEVHSIWDNNELVMIKFDLPLCRNMDRAREIVEVKTGGLVVWSKKDALVAYRGCNYKSTKRSRLVRLKPAGVGQTSIPTNQQKLAKIDGEGIQGREMGSLLGGMNMDGNIDQELINRSLYEREADRLLDGLGPRFIDWWYHKPLPVDGDLLPEVVPGFKPPFRICPPGVRTELTDDELTYLRRLAHPLPTHFVLGRNSKLQGLAVAILKVWEKSIIAKIAIKWGALNTNNELMASELKRLTGGVLILRNKFIIILFRGKDFLPGQVGNLVLEREMELRQWQLHEEDARLKGTESLNLDDEISEIDARGAGTLSEFRQIQTIYGDVSYEHRENEIQLEAEKERLERELKKQEHKLVILRMKIERSAEELMKLNSAWKPSEEEPDQELITEEEREGLRKIGLKMDGVVVLGRRGVFDGVIEGLHQHWKHREVVKVITMQKTFREVIHTATLLERESYGILVSIEKLKEGHGIIIYRGKNYKRPNVKLGGNLLDKRKALRRSLEMQRLGVRKLLELPPHCFPASLKEKGLHQWVSSLFGIDLFYYFFCLFLAFFLSHSSFSHTKDRGKSQI